MVARNRIYDLVHSGAGGSVNGILVSSGTTVNVFNNLVGALQTPAANAANPLVGINLTGGTTLNVDYNSVYLNTSSTGALFGSSALSASTTPTLTLRNNNLVNTSTPSGSGLSVAYRRGSTTLTSYAAASNNNNLFAPALFHDTVNTDTTLAAYRTRVAPRDSVTVSENPPWQSTVGTDPNFLNISTSTPTRLESGGTPVAGITGDVAGNPRNPTTPDIGAWEFAGIALDDTPPSIAYTPLGNTALTGNRTLTPNITDASGVAGGTNAPRVYFRKGTLGPYVSTGCSGSGPTYTCTIDHGLIGGVTVGDVVNYFVVAQDTVTPTPNVGANPNAGFAASNVNTIISPPTNPNSYTIVAGFPGTVNVGTSEAFTSLTNPGGLFEALNAGVLTSNVVATITTDLTAESGTVALNQLVEEGSGAGTYTVTIRPSGNRVVSGAPTVRLIDFNGADRVTIDGLNTAGNSLLIRNEGTGEIIRYINDASGNRLLNTTLEGGAGVTAVNVSTGTTTGNDDILIARNTIRDRTVPTAGLPFNTVGSTATSLTVTNSNLRIEENTLLNFTQAGVLIGVGSDNVTIVANQIRQTAPRTTTLIGIAVNGMTGTNLIRGNTISDLSTNVALSGSQLTGISVIQAVGATTITENVIRNLTYTATSGTFAVTRGMFLGDLRNGVVSRNRIFAFETTTASTGVVEGMRFGGSSSQPSNVTIVNNYIALAPTAAGTYPVYGIFDFAFANNTITVDFNSVFLGGAGSGAASSWAYRRGDLTPTNATVRNNIFYNNRTSATGNHYAIGDQSANTGSWVSNRNVFIGTGVTAGNHFDYGTAAAGTPVNFATWQAGPPARDANSGSANASGTVLGDYFVNAPAGNLNLLPTGTLAVNNGAPIAGITIDIEGKNRLDPPDIGAFELPIGILTISPTSINFGDQTVGSTSPPQTVTLSNVGNAPLVVDPLTAAAAPFARSGGTCSSPPINLNAGASCTLQYTFSPTTTGPASQTLTVTSSGEGSGTIALSGNGVQGNLTITPTAVNFGSQPVGVTSSEQTVTLANTGTASLNVTALTAASAPFARTGSGTCAPVLPIVLGVGASCTLTYTFTPTVVGPANQTLTVTADAPGSGTITLSGNGIVGELTVSPNPANLGNQPIGITSAPLTVTLSNGSAAPITVTALPNPTAPFARSGGSCTTPPFTLNPGNNCTVQYTFTPSAVGPASQNVVIGTAPSGSTTLVLQGNGLPTADLSISKTSNVSFLGLGLIQYTLVVANAGPSNVTSATVVDNFPPALSNVLWNCVGIGGGVCAPSGTGNINQLVDLPAGATVVFSIAANVSLPPPNSISNTATVTPPTGVVDPVASNNTATVTDVVLIFRDGFEGSGPTPPAGVPLVNLSATAPGETATRSLSPAEVQAAAQGPVARDLVAYAIAGNTAVVQVRRLGTVVQARLLIHDGAHWQIGAWLNLDPARALHFEYGTGAPLANGAAVLAARLGQ